MSALGIIGSQDSAREDIAFKTKHRAEERVLAVFKNKIFIDEVLKSSNEILNQTIDYFFKNNCIIPLRQITATSVFPKPYVLVQLTFKAYKDHQERERLTYSMRNG